LVIQLYRKKIEDCNVKRVQFLLYSIMDYIVQLDKFDFDEYGMYIVHCLHNKLFTQNKRSVKVKIENKLLVELVKKLNILPDVLENIVFEYLANKIRVSFLFNNAGLKYSFFRVKVYVKGIINFIPFHFAYEHSLIPMFDSTHSKSCIGVQSHNIDGLLVSNQSSFIEEMSDKYFVQNIFLCNSYLVLLDQFIKNNFNLHNYLIPKCNITVFYDEFKKIYSYFDVFDTQCIIELKITDIEQLIICSMVVRQVNEKMIPSLKKHVKHGDLI